MFESLPYSLQEIIFDFLDMADLLNIKILSKKIFQLGKKFLKTKIKAITEIEQESCAEALPNFDDLYHSYSYAQIRWRLFVSHKACVYIQEEIATSEEKPQCLLSLSDEIFYSTPCLPHWSSLWQERYKNQLARFHAVTKSNLIYKFN